MAKNKAYDNDFDTSTDFGTSSRTSASGSSGVSQRISGLGDSAASRIDDSPLIALGAGIALGAVLGATLPISRKERELLEPLGRKLNDASTSAIDRSRTMAKQKFDEMAGDKVREFLGGNTTSSGSTTGV